jgi:hypothetical protein
VRVCVRVCVCACVRVCVCVFEEEKKGRHVCDCKVHQYMCEHAQESEYNLHDKCTYTHFNKRMMNAYTRVHVLDAQTSSQHTIP